MSRTIDYIGAPLELDDYEERHRLERQRVVNGVPVDPCLRETFDMTPNEERDQQELDDWWDRPFVVSYRDSSPGFTAHWPTGERFDVRCLDGGAWDRSTLKGSYATLDEAVDAASALAARGPDRWDVVAIDGNVLFTGSMFECERWLNSADVGSVFMRLTTPATDSTS